jgi:hypothetical protein
MARHHRNLLSRPLTCMVTSLKRVITYGGQNKEPSLIYVIERLRLLVARCSFTLARDRLDCTKISWWHNAFDLVIPSFPVTLSY